VLVVARQGLFLYNLWNWVWNECWISSIDKNLVKIK